MTRCHLLGIIVSAVAIFVGIIYDALYMLTGQITQSSSTWFGCGMFLGGTAMMLHFLAMAKHQETLNEIKEQLSKTEH